MILKMILKFKNKKDSKGLIFGQFHLFSTTVECDFAIISTSAAAFTDNFKCNSTFFTANKLSFL